MVETVGNIGGEDAVRRQRRHAQLHRPNVKHTAAAAVDVLALGDEIILDLALQVPHAHANEHAGALHGSDDREHLAYHNVTFAFRHDCSEGQRQGCLRPEQIIHSREEQGGSL